MLELKKKQLTTFPKIDDPFTEALVKANIHELLNCESKINFTQHFLRYATYIGYTTQYFGHSMPVSDNEIQDLFIYRIHRIQEKIFNTIFIRFADLLHELLALSRIEKSKEEIIALMVTHQVSAWHLYDEIMSYQLTQRTSSQLGSSSHSDQLIGRLLTHPSYMEDEIRLWQKQTLTRELESIARSIVGDHKKRSSMLIAIFRMKGKSLLPLIHSHSHAYPLLEQLISNLQDMLKNKVEKKEIENLINTWYDAASSSSRSAVNLASSEKSDTIKPKKFL